MPRTSEADKLKQLHAEALADFDAIQAAVRDERLQCLEDRRFSTIAGAQWEGAVGDAFENKPRFEFNLCHRAVKRVMSEYRNNRITVDFQPPDGSTDDEMADHCDGLYRADEAACAADEAYDNAADEAFRGGFGAWRLVSCYEDEEDPDNDKQRIRHEPIFDADQSVFFDLGARRQDKSDAKRAYVLIPVPRKAYTDEYGDDPSSWPKDIQKTEFDWVTPDVVHICEHYRIEEVSEKLRVFRGLTGDERKVTEAEIEADPGLMDELAATGFRLVREKPTKRRKVRKLIMNGARVIEDCGHIAGRDIPIVPVYGERWVVDGIERCQGVVRMSKDAQRLHNMLMSWLAEMAARFDVSKPILTPEQIAGHAHMWAEDAVKKYPYLLVNPLTDANGNIVATGPTAYTKAPEIPPAMAALSQLAQQALTDLLGNQEAGDDMLSNQSGKAVELVQQRLDMQAFIYISNLAKSHKRSGEIWLGMMKDICVEESRRMKTLSPDGEANSIVVNEPAYDPDKGIEYVRNDMSRCTYDVIADVGPSSTSKRSAIVRALTGLTAITQDPETAQALTLTTVSNLEGEGLADLRKWARGKAIRMGLMTPTDEEKAELQAEAQNQPPDPQQQYLLAAAEQAQADAVQSRAKVLDTVAAAQLKQAQAAKVAAETDGAQQQQVINAADAIVRHAGGGDAGLTAQPTVQKS